MEKVEREVKVTKYIAFDGTEFDTEIQCQQYEQGEVSKLLSELNCFGCVLQDELLQCGYKFYVLMPRTRHDIYVINEILKKCNSKDKALSDDMYRPLILSVRLYFGIGTYAQLVRLDSWMEGISNGKFTVVSLIKEEKVKQAEK